MARHASTRRTFVLACLAAAGAASLSRAQTSSGSNNDRIERLFRQFDTDGDGRISRDEFELKKVEIVFAPSSGRGATLKFGETHLSRAAFDSLDLDHDGILTAGEVIAAPLFSFDNWDTNHDGYISREEFADQFRRINR